MSEIKSFKIAAMIPPKDDLTARLDSALPPLVDGDIIVISSKVVAIDEGRCHPISEYEKDDLVAQESDTFIPRKYNQFGFALSIIHHALIASAGIDESNGDGYYIMLPKDPFASAKRYYDYLKDKHQLNDLGVIISDSHCIPLRRGVVDISIGFWGFKPSYDYRGETDIFGRTIQYSRSNCVDAIAAAAGGHFGEGNECSPIALVRGWPQLQFTGDAPDRDDFLTEPEEDVFTPLLDVFKQYQN